MGKLLTTKQAANMLGLSPRTLQAWRVDGNGPMYIRIGHNRVLYDPADIQSWLDERRFRSTSEEAARAAQQDV